ncbi:hypothetical protein MBLNU230_g6485t1 [Neophaeotheca triangularis]
MDFNGGDIPMLDDDVLVTTEDISVAPAGEPKPEITANHDIQANGSLSKASTPAPLKGAGLKRSREDFTHDLTDRKDVPRPPKYDALPYSTGQTGLVYDVRMRFHVEGMPDDEIHPEDPRRIHAIFQAFVGAGLAWSELSSSNPPSLDYYMGRIDTRRVTRDEVCLVHTPAHWDWVQSIAEMSADEMEIVPKAMDSIYLSPNTPFCAMLSAGGAIEACRAIMLGKVKNTFAVIRPPGHHAEREDAKGFCFFDNVSIATKVCQREFGDRCRKVLILDWDVHHGNGIQQAHYDDPNVLYISLHRHQNGQYYPENSYRDERNKAPYGANWRIGEGTGKGKNVNIPFSAKENMGDAEYIYAFQQVVMPIATEFDPDLVIVAAGFDAAAGDVLGGYNVTPAGYAHMTHMLMSLAEGRLAVCLEGGYNLDSIARSATEVARTMMGEPPPRLEEDVVVAKSAVDDVKGVLRQHSHYWQNLYPKAPSDLIKAPPANSQRMDSVVRTWQATTLFEEYEMIPLFIQRESLSKTFENQVLATQDYDQARPLLVILHDPPEALASPDPRTGKIELHNTWVTDEIKTYIDWAASRNHAIIDINLPRHTTYDADDPLRHTDPSDSETRSTVATNLLTYLWENYLEFSPSPCITLLGTNTGHCAIANFIKAHPQRAVERIALAVSLVGDVALQGVRSSTFEGLDAWYYSHSAVFIAKDHGFWDTDYASRKPKKRFGRILESDKKDVGGMLGKEKERIFDKIKGVVGDWRIEDMEVEEDGGVGEEDDVAEGGLRMPPVGNFALSASGAAGSTRGRGSGSVTPRAGAGDGVGGRGTLPLLGNFASPRRGMGSPGQ